MIVSLTWKLNLFKENRFHFKVKFLILPALKLIIVIINVLMLQSSFDWSHSSSLAQSLFEQLLCLNPT